MSLLLCKVSIMYYCIHISTNYSAAWFRMGLSSFILQNINHSYLGPFHLMVLQLSDGAEPMANIFSWWTQFKVNKNVSLIFGLQKCAKYISWIFEIHIGTCCTNCYSTALLAPSLEKWSFRNLQISLQSLMKLLEDSIELTSQSLDGHKFATN